MAQTHFTQVSTQELSFWKNVPFSLSAKYQCPHLTSPWLNFLLLTISYRCPTQQSIICLIDLVCPSLPESKLWEDKVCVFYFLLYVQGQELHLTQTGHSLNKHLGE